MTLMGTSSFLMAQKTKGLRVGEAAQWVKALAAQTGDLGSKPRLPMEKWKERTSFCKVLPPSLFLFPSLFFSPSLSLLPTPTVNQNNKTFKNYTSPHFLATKRCKEAFQGQTGSSHGYILQAGKNELTSKGKCLSQKLCHCLINVFFPTLFNHFLLK